MRIMNKQILPLKKNLDTLFLILTGVYLLWQFSTQTTFFLQIPPFFNRLLFGVTALVAFLRVSCERLSIKRTGISIAVALVYFLVYLNDRYLFLLYTAVIIVGMEDIDYHQILKLYLLTVGLGFAITVLAGLTGTITNYIYIRAERGIRSSLGICYPTDLASTYFYILLFLWVAWKELPDWVMCILSVSSLYLSARIAYSSTGVICSLLFFAALLYHMLEQRINVKIPRKFVFLVVDNLLTAAFPIFGGGFFALMIIYAKGMKIGYKLDGFLSQRLRLSVEAFRNYGVKLFGTPFEQVGAGFSSIVPGDYNFVDSSYPLILIRYGIVLFLVSCVLWCLMTKKAIQMGDQRLALVMALIAFHSVSEHHFIEMQDNVLLAMPFASYAMPTKGDTKKNAKNKDMVIVAASIIAAIAVYFACILGPSLLSWIKTIYEIKGLVGGKAHAPWVITGNLLILLISTGIVWSIYKLLTVWITDKKIAKKPFLSLLLCFCITSACCAYARDSVRSEIRLRAESLKAERGVINLALKTASGKVYAGTCPAIFKTCFPGISYSTFCGEELARHYGSTVIMDPDTEYESFIKSGFLYTRISEDHSIYTSDPEVIRALSNAGLHLTSYYSTEKTVNMRYEAGLNGLSYSKKNGVLVKGPGQSLLYGPYLDLFGGQYTVTFHLAVPEGGYRKNSFLGLLQICGGWG